MMYHIKKHALILASLTAALSLLLSGCALAERIAGSMENLKTQSSSESAETQSAEAPAPENAGSDEDPKEEKPAPETSDETAETRSEDQDAEQPGDESPSSAGDETQAFDFRDAEGKEYEAEIDRNIRPNPYDPFLFKHSKGFLAYDDPDFNTCSGIDVSSHQGGIDWRQVKEAGVEFAFVRIGYRGYGPEGTLVEDEYALNNIDAAHEAGLLVGGYFFSQAVNEEEAKEEASFAMSILAGRDLELPLAFDAEHIRNDSARTDTVTGEQFTKNAEAFCEAVRSGGYEPMIYSNLLWEAFVYNMASLSKYPFWYADYEAIPQTPYAFLFWQYSESGSVPGVDGNVDMDIWMRKRG